MRMRINLDCCCKFFLLMMMSAFRKVRSTDYKLYYLPLLGDFKLRCNTKIEKRCQSGFTPQECILAYNVINMGNDAN